MAQKTIDNIVINTTPQSNMIAIDDNFNELYPDVAANTAKVTYLSGSVRQTMLAGPDLEATPGTLTMVTSRPNPTDNYQDNGDGIGTWVANDLAIWEAEIALTDSVLPRYLEDLYDANPGLIRGVWTEEKYQTKKGIRGRKPVV